MWSAHEALMKSIVALIAVLITMVFVSPLSAQTCMGAPSLRGHPGQVSGRIGRSGDALNYGVGVGVGRTLFAGIRFTVSPANDWKMLTTTIGFEVATGNRLAFCPLAEYHLVGGPTRSFYVVNRGGIEGGGHLGVVAMRSTLVRIIPTAGIVAGYSRSEYTFADPRRPQKITSGSYGWARVGLGFVFNDRFGLTPTASYSLTADNANVVFVIPVTFAFGG
jgi:hypothetical protein